MANVLIDENSMTAIADAIRSKKGVSTTYKPSDMADAIESISGGITPTGTKNITENGTHDVTQYASASVNVPNSYSASDEGKVVSNGALVSQTSDSVTANGTVDTTLINSLLVNVSGNTPKAEGDFTITADAADNCPTITHNLNTQKIAVLIYPAEKIIFSTYFRVFYLQYINVNAFMSDDLELDFTSYSSKLTSMVTVAMPSNEVFTGNVHLSPQANITSWNGSTNNYAIINQADMTLTDNTFKYNGSGYRARFAPGKYHYIIWKLG